MRRWPTVVFITFACSVIGFCLLQWARLLRFHLQDGGASLFVNDSTAAGVVGVVMLAGLPALPLLAAFWIWKIFRPARFPEPVVTDGTAGATDGWCPHCGLELLTPGAQTCPECGGPVGGH